jgi:hypothetical protein
MRKAFSKTRIKQRGYETGLPRLSLANPRNAGKKQYLLVILNKSGRFWVIIDYDFKNQCLAWLLPNQ